MIGLLGRLPTRKTTETSSTTTDTTSSSAAAAAAPVRRSCLRKSRFGPAAAAAAAAPTTVSRPLLTAAPDTVVQSSDDKEDTYYKAVQIKISNSVFIDRCYRCKPNQEKQLALKKLASTLNQCNFCTPTTTNASTSSTTIPIVSPEWTMVAVETKLWTLFVEILLDDERGLLAKQISRAVLFVPREKAPIALKRSHQNPNAFRTPHMLKWPREFEEGAERGSMIVQIQIHLKDNHDNDSAFRFVGADDDHNTTTVVTLQHQLKLRMSSLTKSMHTVSLAKLP